VLRCEYGFLLPQGEGQDEGVKKPKALSFHPLTLALSLRERELLHCPQLKL